MRNEQNVLCNICHAVIPAQHVFSENDQVYLKKSKKEISRFDTGNDEWFPINFQWMPLIELKKSLKLQSTLESI
ncbi:MAG: hypothetical protein WBG90_02130 [Saonia sp.]